MICKDEWDHAVDFAKSGTLFADSVYHGEEHWRAVASQGLLLSDICNLGAAGRAAAALFGLFHDCRRQNDEYDPEHGARAAEAFIIWSSGTQLKEDFCAELEASMVLHDKGQTTTRLIAGLGWDADRSTLGRVGMTPSLPFFSCIPELHFDSFIEAGENATAFAPSWDNIYAKAFG